MSLPSYVPAIFGDLREEGATCTTAVPSTSSVHSGDASSDSGLWIDRYKLNLALSGLPLSRSLNGEVRVLWSSEVSKRKAVILTPDSQSNAKVFTLTLLIHFYFIFQRFPQILHAEMHYLRRT